MLKEKFGSVFAEMQKISHAAEKIDETKVYEEANLELRPYMWKLLDEAFNSESGLGNIENFKAFYDCVINEGKTGLILMEHYTNLDLPGILYLLEKNGEEWAKDMSQRIVAVAGISNVVGLREALITKVLKDPVETSLCSCLLVIRAG